MYLHLQFVLVYYYYFFVNCIVNVSAQCIVFIRGIITGQLTIIQLVIMVVAITVFMYDDIKCLKVMKEYSLQHYEAARLLQLKQIVSTSNRNLVHIDDKKLNQHLTI